MAYTTNRFCWHGCATTDSAASRAFYTEVIGWNAMDVPMGEGTAAVFAAQDIPFAHIAAPATEGVPSHWSSFLRVDDVDASTKAVVEHGGSVLAEPMDIVPGRMSVVASPSGAALCLFHEADSETSSHHPGGVGSVHWVELNSTDAAADLAWLKGTFGFDVDEMPMEQGPYYILKDGDDMRGGMMAAMPGVPSAWLVWIHVEDLDATMERTKGHGGNVLSPVIEVPGTGRMAVIADPTGGVIGIIQPSNG